jgi:hypothetical protein
MRDDFTITSYRDDTHRGVMVTASMMDTVMARYTPEMLNAVMRAIADKLADEYVKSHGQEILAKLDQQAIANLTIAEAANGIRDAIHKKLPDVIHTRVEREVYQRGVLGKLRRVG